MSPRQAVWKLHAARDYPKHGKGLQGRFLALTPSLRGCVSGPVDIKKHADGLLREHCAESIATQIADGINMYREVHLTGASRWKSDVAVLISIFKIDFGVLALQGAYIEHLLLLKQAAHILTTQRDSEQSHSIFDFIEVRNATQLSECDALVIPGGESTTMSLVAAHSGLLEPLRDFVKVHRHPTWGTCAGLILLAEAANSVKRGGQELIGGLDVRVNRNHFGRQVESFQANLDLPFLHDSPEKPFPGVFIRAPIVEKILPHAAGSQLDEAAIDNSVVAPSRTAADNKARAVMSSEVNVMAVLPGRLRKVKSAGLVVPAGEEEGDIVAVQQGNVFGTSFHPELTKDARIHAWWLSRVVEQLRQQDPSRFRQVPGPLRTV